MIAFTHPAAFESSKSISRKGAGRQCGFSGVLFFFPFVQTLQQAVFPVCSTCHEAAHAFGFILLVAGSKLL